MASDGTGTVIIPAEEWQEFIQKYLPFSGSAEYATSSPKYNEQYDVEFEYAFSDFCHPSTWIEPPEWLKEKK